MICSGGNLGGLAEQVAGDRSGVSSAAVLPEVNGLPGAQQQLSVTDTQAEGLAGERGSDVGRHVIGSFVVMQITAVFRNGIGHPCIEVLQHPWISVLVDREACAGVQTGEIQHALLKARAPDPGVQSSVQAGEALPRGLDRNLMQDLLHAHRSPAFSSYFACCSSV